MNQCLYLPIECRRRSNELHDSYLDEPGAGEEYDRFTEWQMACREASTLDECLGLVHLATNLGGTLGTLIKVPLLGTMLRAMRVPAHAAGFGALQEFLESGYTTFKEIPDVDHFLTEIRMTEFFGKIYTKPLDGLD